MKLSFTRKRNTRLHSREHVLAEDLSQMMLEPRRFAAYLGFAERYSEDDLRALAKRVIAKSDLLPRNRGRYFFAATKGLLVRSDWRPRKQRIRKKRARRTTRRTTV